MSSLSPFFFMAATLIFFAAASVLSLRTCHSHSTCKAFTKVAVLVPATSSMYIANTTLVEILKQQALNQTVFGIPVSCQVWAAVLLAAGPDWRVPIYSVKAHYW
jgi:hypothetical protein